MWSLGVNYSQMHDSAAALLRDGEIVFAIAEERLSRTKHDPGFPLLAIQAAFNFAGITAQELDFVCYGWQPPGDAFRHDLSCYLRGRVPASGLNVLNSARHFASMWRRQNGHRIFERHFGPVRARALFVEHHLAHALSAYALSGFDDAAVLIIDGRGAWEATSFWHGHDGRLEHRRTIDWPDSLGMFYAEMTQFLGFQKYSDEWKVMGLAPYGRSGIDLGEFIQVTPGSPNGSRCYHVNSRALLGDGRSAPAIAGKLGPARQSESEITQRDKDIAFSVQDACERAILALAAQAAGFAHSRNLCLAGGVALNSKANGKLLTSGICDHLFIQPAAGDDGVAIGAALAPMMDGGRPLALQQMRHVFLGNEVSDDQIQSILRTCKIRAVGIEDPALRGAELLAAGKILGWFQGRMEFGPRSLGNRSILADPRDPAMKDRVNNAVKFRESWRPFAPALLAEAASTYLESAHDSPFMILTSQVREEKQSEIPAVTHVDGSARPQTVEERTNPLFHRLISQFQRLTGVPVLLNTSFNLRGEPIVCTVADALRTFYSSGLDALVIGGFLIEK